MTDVQVLFIVLVGVPLICFVVHEYSRRKGAKERKRLASSLAWVSFSEAEIRNRERDRIEFERECARVNAILRSAGVTP